MKRCAEISLLQSLLLVAIFSQTTQITSDDLLKQLQNAEDAVIAGDFSAANKLLRSVLAVRPKNVHALTLAGIVAERTNDIQAASRYFSLAAKLDPTSPAVRNNYGAILARLGKRDEAAVEFEKSLKLNPKQPSAQINLAQIYFENGSPDSFRASRALFERVLAESPDLRIARALVLTSIRLQDAERASSDFQKYYSLTTATDPPIAERLELAKGLLSLKLFSESVRELEAAVSSDSTNIEALIALSGAYLGKKDITAAGKTLESAVARGIDDAKIYAALSGVYSVGGYIENAIPTMRMAIEKNPSNEFYRARYGLLLIDSRSPTAAIIRLAEATSEFPNSPSIWLALGIAQQKTGKSIDAKNSFERVLQLDPKSIAGLAYLGTTQVDQAQYDEAAATFRKAISLEEKSAVLQYLLADTLLKIPQVNSAEIERSLTRAVQLDPSFAQAHFSLGKLLIRSENWAGALREFEQTVRYAPDYAEAYYQLGRVYSRLRRIDESQKAFARHKQLSNALSVKEESERQELVRRLANVEF